MEVNYYFAIDGKNFLIHAIKVNRRSTKLADRNEMRSIEAFRWKCMDDQKYPWKFEVKRPEEWRILMDQVAMATDTLGRRFFSELEESTMVIHENVWAFYETVGYDRKKKRFK